MNVATRIITLMVCLFVGALFCAYQNGWLIISLPLVRQKLHTTDTMPSNVQKKVTLTWWHGNAWHTESSDIIWPADRSCALQALVQAWLALLDEEMQQAKPVVLQVAMLSADMKTAYLSFDRNPFCKQASMYEKLRWVDGLTKTLRDNGLVCTHIQLLAQHKPLIDVHLDFSRPWPVRGFIDGDK